jgi:hypothetical protein
LRPLAETLAHRLSAYLDKLTYAIRAGTHADTAFAIALAQEYARVCGDDELSGAATRAVGRWYLAETAAVAAEPSGEDFLSPTLIEAECVRRSLTGDDFRTWFANFLPQAAEGRPAALFEPAVVADRSDGRIVHLDGLNLSRAWCWRAIAGALDEADPARTQALSAAERHLQASFAYVAGDYAGEHWLATYAILALREG